MTLTELIQAGYHCSGTNWPCGCHLVKWVKKGKVVFEYKERCKEHRATEAGNPDMFCGTPKKWEEYTF